MKIRNDHKLFIVEFGKPDSPGSYSSYGTKSLYVIAKTYDEAAAKGMDYVLNCEPEKGGVIGYDGSLNINSEELKVKTVKLACENIVF